MSNSSKPRKPYPEFPLFPHATGRWAKKIRGKLHYFGPWGDPQAALQRYLDQRDDLHAGRIPRAKQAGLTLADLCNRFLDAKMADVERGDILRRTWVSLRRACKWAVDTLGRARLAEDLRPEDFAALLGSIDGRAPTTRTLMVAQVRSVFKWGVDERLIANPYYGRSFRAPPRKAIRRHRRENGKRGFTADEIRSLLDAAEPQLRAMILLGINCGFGNTDCATLRLEAVKGEWVEHPRPKTEVERRCWLWPETQQALREVVGNRTAGPVFLRRGQPWVRMVDDNPFDYIAVETRRLMRRVGITRRGLGFYGLRRTFETVAQGTLDFPAVVFLTGHVDPSMTGTYRQAISDDRLRAVAEHVRKWLLGNQDQG